MSAQIIRLKEVIMRTGISRSSVYAYMKDNRFPKSVKLGKHASGWVAEEIDNWIEERIRQRGDF